MIAKRREKRITEPCKGLKIPKKVMELAYKIHKCPGDYRGPCWGPTQSDICSAQARIDIAAIRATRRPRRAR